MYPIKQSTAITVPFFVHDVAGDAVTGLTNGSYTKRISKNGAAFGAMTVVITELENGWYSIPLSTSHSDTVGLLSITFTNAGSKQINLQFRVSVRIPDDLSFPTVAGRSLDVTTTGAAGIDWANVEGQATSVNLSSTTTNLVNTATTLTGHTAQTADHTAAIADIPTVAEFNARTILSASYFDPAADTVVNVTNVATLTGHTVQTGDSFARIGVAGAGLTDITLNEASIDLIWDEVLTGATHNVTNSSGQRLRQIPTTKFAEGTAQSGGNNSIQLAVGDVTTDNQFKRAKVLLVKGLGLGQEAIITGSTASTDTLTVTPAWLTNPDATSVYEVLPAQAHSTVNNGGYDNGFVFVDTTNGTAGAIAGVNGTSTNPSSVLADARTIANLENIRKFNITGGSVFSLDQSYTDWLFVPISAALITLNSQDISGSVFMRSAVTGIGTATTRGVFELCQVEDATVGICNFLQCGFTGTTVLSAEDKYLAWDCFEFDTTVPIIDMAGDGATPTTLELIGYSGRIEIQNMTSVDTLVLTGQASLILNANCSGGTATIAGDVKITDNSGNVTITEANISDILVDTNELQTDWTNAGRLDTILDARMAEASINTTGGAVDVVTTNTDMRGTDSALLAANYVDHTAAIADIPTVAEFNARTIASADYFDPAVDTVATVTTVTNQVTANVTAISGDSAAADNLEASLETLVLGTATGVPTATTMADSALTEATDDHFNGRIIIWRTGVLALQATDITSYNGTTKTFTFTAVVGGPAGAGDAYVIV
jgi:hypothetical protein